MWERQNETWCRVLMDPGICHVGVRELVLTDENYDLLEKKAHICGYYIVSGALTCQDMKLGKDTMIWFTGGNRFPVKTQEAPRVILIETEQPLKTQDPVFQVFEEERIPWSRDLKEGITASRHMIRPEEFGVKVQTCIYTRNFRHERHSHSTAHGFYVLEGMLAYQTGDRERQILGPGEFAMSLAGEQMLHEPARGSWCRYLFIGDGLFDFLVDGVDQYNK